MARFGTAPFAFPEFRGATRQLVVWNLAAYFGLAVLGLASPGWERAAELGLRFSPRLFLHGWLWQPLTYSLVHPTLYMAFFELLSLWFLAGFLEGSHASGWVLGLYGSAVAGTAAGALLLEMAMRGLGMAAGPVGLWGCFGGIFGLLIAIGILHGETQFLLFFTIGIKARYMAAIYGLLAFAMLFSGQSVAAFAQLGGALGGLLWIRLAPRRGVAFAVSEGWFGLRNRYYRWKRRRAARKFEVYMRSQGRTVRFDGQGRPIDKDHDDRSRWN